MPALVDICSFGYTAGYVDGRQGWAEPDGTQFRLYRSSAVIEGTAMHVATFNAQGGEAYNRENCQTAARQFQNQPGVVVTYWCEKLLPSD